MDTTVPVPVELMLEIIEFLDLVDQEVRPSRNLIRATLRKARGERRPVTAVPNGAMLGMLEVLCNLITARISLGMQIEALLASLQEPA